MEQPSVIRAGSHEGLLAAIPYLLRFHPHDSVVFVLQRADRVVLTARLGLDEVEKLPEPQQQLQQLALVSDADAISLVCYHDDHVRGLTAVAALAQAATIPVSDILHATATHFWAVCCSDDPEPQPYDVSSHPVAAEAVLAGVSVLPSRSDVQRLAAGPDPGDAAIIAADAAASQQLRHVSPQRRVGLTVTLVEHHVADPAGLDATTAAMIARLIDDVACRDAAWLSMTRVTADQHVALWSRVVAHTLPPWETPPLCLLGMAAWLAGQGALHVECIERASRIRPSYSLLHILDDIQARALPPAAWDDLTVGLDMREECRPDAPPIITLPDDAA